MKKISILVIAIFSIVSCNKDKINNTADKVGISKVTHFPILTVAGDDIIAIENGSTYNEPGVTAKAGDADVPVTTSGTVNTGQDGVYTLTYSAVNPDGFSATATRTVAVYTTAADAASHDLSGSYLRPATGVLCTWTKIAPGVYRVFNPGGAAGTNVTVVVFNPEGYTIDMPIQLIADGSPMNSTDEIYTNSDPATYSWKIVNKGYGTGLRTFIKQ
jgi:hypothetical protein